MPYIGKSPLHGNYSKLDDFSGDFDGSDATHALAINGISLTPVTEAAVLISINGVLQEPVTDYTVSGTNITFTTAPASTASFFGVVLGEQLAGNTPSDSTITSAKLSGNLVTPGTLDVNGQELILDADADTSITASTDDTIDIKISGADDFQFTANTFTVLSGSTLTVASGATIANSGTATGFGGSDPASADGDTLGTASLEWSDLYLADGGIIYLGNDQDVTLTHNADTGVTCNTALNAANLQLAGYQLNGFTIDIMNDSGTLKHRMGRSGSAGGASGYHGSITSPSVTLTATPTGTDSSTAFATGLKVSSAAAQNIFLDTPTQMNVALWMGIAVITGTQHGAHLHANHGIASIDINGTTRQRPRISIYDHDQSGWAINTTNIASGEWFSLEVWFWALTA